MRPDLLPRPALLVATLLVTHLVLLTTGTAHAQGEMSFGVEESRPKAYVVVLTDSGVDKKARAAILNRINDFVAGHGVWELLYEADAKRAADKKTWKSFGRCKDIPCALEHGRQMDLQRMFIVEFSRERDNIVAVDIELDDVVTGKVLNYTVAVTDDLAELSFLDGPMEELLKGQNDVGQVIVAQSGGGGANNGGGIEEPEVPGEPFVLPRSWAYYTWATAGAVFATGAVFGYLALSTQGELQDTFHDRTEIDRLIADGESSQSTANLLFISSLGVAAVGGVLYWLGEDAPEPEKAKGGLFGSRENPIDLHIAPTGVGVTVRY